MTKNDREYKTRSERNKETQSKIEDQGNNQKKYLFVVLALIIIILIVLFNIFSNSADDTTEDTGNEIQTTEVTVNEPSEDSESSEESTDTADDTTSDSSEEESTEETSESEEENEIDTESLEEAGLELVEPESDDAIGAYTGDWEPMGTEQTGEHVTTYTSGSQDRIEIKQAAAAVTGLNPDTMIEHWVGNDGTADGVYATVSDGEQTELYRVHLQWQDGAGWQPTVVEILN